MQYSENQSQIQQQVLRSLGQQGINTGNMSASDIGISIKGSDQPIRVLNTDGTPVSDMDQQYAQQQVGVGESAVPSMRSSVGGAESYRSSGSSGYSNEQSHHRHPHHNENCNDDRNINLYSDTNGMNPESGMNYRIKSMDEPVRVYNTDGTPVSQAEQQIAQQIAGVGSTNHSNNHRSNKMMGNQESSYRYEDENDETKIQQLHPTARTQHHPHHDHNNNSTSGASYGNSNTGGHGILSSEDYTSSSAAYGNKYGDLNHTGMTDHLNLPSTHQQQPMYDNKTMMLSHRQQQQQQQQPQYTGGSGVGGEYREREMNEKPTMCGGCTVM